MQRKPESDEIKELSPSLAEGQTNGNGEGEGNHDDDTENKNDKRITGMRQQFAIGATGAGSSSIEDRHCCTNMALMVYKKAWEGARKALPRAARHRNESDLKRSQGLSKESARTTSLESEDDPATECSFEYDEDGDLANVISLRSTKPTNRSLDRPTTLRGLESLSTDVEEFAEDEDNDGPGEVDLEAFKRTYMSDLVIPEEPEKEAKLSEQETEIKKKSEENGGRRRRRVRLDDVTETSEKQEKEDLQTRTRQQDKVDEPPSETNLTHEKTNDRSTVNSNNVEEFVKSTCDQVMATVKEKVASSLSTSPDHPSDDSPARGSGIFKVKPPLLSINMRNDESQESKESTDVVTTSSIEIPTITITEDQLDDSSVVLTEATLRDETGSEGEFGIEDLPEDGSESTQGIKGKAERIRSKVKRLGSKVKDIFKKGSTPEVPLSGSPTQEYIDMEEEKKRRKEEEREAERRKREEEAAKKEEERKKKEEAERKKKEEELEKRALEMERKAEAEARKEEERRRKEEIKKKKEEEKRLKEEEEKRKKEEERRKKEEERARKEEEKRIKAEEERKKKEEEKKRKEEERLRKMKEDEERERRKKEDEERERERIRKEDAERVKREEERGDKESKLKKENEEEGAILKRKLEEEITSQINSQSIFQDKDNSQSEDATHQENDHPYYNVEGVLLNRRASSPSLPSAPASVAMSTSTSQATIMMTSVSSRIRERSPSREDETCGQTGESDIDGDHHEGRRRKKMRKRLRDTKAKLINLKSKALESLPSMSTLKSRVKEILPTISNVNHDQQNHQLQSDIYAVKREQKIFSEYRKRYPDSENEFFSDSELVESRKSTLKASGPNDGDGTIEMYEDIEATTEDRVQLLLSPITSPLRPPRRSDFAGGLHASEPNISRTGTPKKPKRAPPPRPPPPAIEGGSLEVLDEIDLAGSSRDLSQDIRQPETETKIPPSIFYRKVVRDWQERNLKRLDEIISASSPNLSPVHRPPRPGRPPPPPSSLYDRPRPLPRRRQSRASILRQARAELEANKENVDGYEVLSSRMISDLGLPPLPPPRLRSDRRTTSRSPSTSSRSASASIVRRRHLNLDYFSPSDKADLATDCLYWKPFSWKTGRCRSLTELYVRKRTQQSQPVEINSLERQESQEPIERSLSYRLMSQYCAPPRPPPPTITMTAAIDAKLSYSNSAEPIYSTIDRSKKLKRDPDSNLESPVTSGSGDGLTIIQSRPLPAPPLPPRSKRKTRSRSGSPYVSLTGSSIDLNPPDATLIRSVSPFFGISVKDASVDTQSDIPYKSEEVGCQTSLEDIDIEARPENLTSTLNTQLDVSRSDSVTPTPNNVSVRITSDSDIRPKETEIESLIRNRLSSSSSKDSSPPMVTASSGKAKPGSDEASNRTMTSYYDAEECDTDMDTFADLESISEATLTATSSQYHSVRSDPSTTSTSSSATATADYGDAKSSSLPAEIVVSSTSLGGPLVAEGIIIDEDIDGDSDDELLRPRITSTNEVRAYISRHRVRPDSMDGSDPEW